jgi:hypothetical protein
MAGVGPRLVAVTGMTLNTRSYLDDAHPPEALVDREAKAEEAQSVQRVGRVRDFNRLPSGRRR